MSFTSLNFIAFFVIVVVVYYMIPSNRWRKVFLLVSSYYFYACWDVAFLGILLYETLISYTVGIFFDKYVKKKGRKGLLWISIVLLLAPLLSFKYLDFLLSTLNDVVSFAGITMTIPLLGMMLPVGISFYSFMSLSYVIDMYNRKYKAEVDILDYALFVGFFPQITSGPIGRANLMLPQYKEKKKIKYDNFAVGSRMMLWGYFMKLVVGDRAGIYVDTVFGEFDSYSGISLVLATFMYSVQIYCDFAGYSLIAIGAGKVMGFDLMTNFKRPYFAKNLGDFWRRWHISLSSWFRDYVYIPLGGNRCGKCKMYVNLMITFLVSGLWHGAAYNFVLWGGAHGAIQCVEKSTKNISQKAWNRRHLPRIRQIASILLTFFLVSYLWMIFYSADFNTILGITKGYFHKGPLFVDPTTLFFFAIGFLLLLVKDVKDEFFPNSHFLLESKHVVVRYFSFAAIIVLIVTIGVLGGGQFIYFKF